MAASDEKSSDGKTAGAKPDPAGQSPEEPIHFDREDEVGKGNEERANAEPEPAALHAAEVPGVPDVAARRREKQHTSH